jgi:ComF family protein
MPRAAKSAWECVLDIVVPQDPTIRRIEGMELSVFLDEARAEMKPRKDGICAFLPYRAPLVRAGLVELKDRENKKVATMLGQALLHFLLRVPEYGANCLERPLVLPIPITKKRRRERGWNQCELILDGLHAADRGNAFEIRFDILAKICETEDQVGKTRTERQKNLRGTFAVVRPEIVVGRSVVVFDDIVTTGSTLEEARRTLLAAGSVNVRCVALSG